MITKLDRSSGRVVGFTVSGDVAKADYDVLNQGVESALSESDTASVLLDLTGFHWEKVEAWGADLAFGHTYRKRIDRMAIVGDKKWEEHLAHLAKPFYAEDSAFFADADDAWAWLERGAQ